MRERIARLSGRIFSDSTVRGTLTLASCTTLGAALMILAAPALTRLFTPEVFGVVAVYASIVSIIYPVASLRYDLAVLLPDNEDEAVNLLALSLFVLLLISGVLALLVWFTSGAIAGWLHTKGLAPYLWIVPLGVLGGGGYQALSSWALRNEEYGKIARTRLGQNAGMAATQIGLGVWLSGSAIGLLAGDLVSRFGGVGSLMRLAWPALTGGKLSLRMMRAAAVRYGKFPLYSTPASMLTAIETQIPTILLSRFFGPAVAGYYALTYRVLRTPTSFLGQAAAQSLFANAARLSRDRERLQQLTERATIVLMAVGLPVFAIVIQEGGDLFARIFGPSWREAGVYAQILSPWLFVSFVSNPLSNLLTVREWQGTTLLYSALECTTAVSALSIGILYRSDLVALSCLGIGSCLFSLITMDRFFKAGFTRAGRVINQAAPLLLPLALCALLAGSRFGGGGTLPITLRVLALLAVYSFSLWKLRRFATA